jgi:hypothetical protein
LCIYSTYSYSCLLNHVAFIITAYDRLAKKIKNASQDIEAKAKTEEDHAKGKPIS